MDFISIGSLTIPYTLFSFFLTAFITAGLFRYLSSKKTGDLFWNTIFISFLVWKASYILFNFHLFLQSPMSVLFFNGGKSGLIIAGMAILIYWYWLFKKNPELLYKEALPLYILYFSIYETILYLLKSNVLAASLFLIITLLSSYIIHQNKKIKLSFELFIVYELVMLFLFSILNKALSWESAVFFSLGIIILIFSQIFKEGK